MVDDFGVITRFGCGESSPVGADGVRIHLKVNSEYGFPRTAFKAATMGFKLAEFWGKPGRGTIEGRCAGF